MASVVGPPDFTVGSVVTDLPGSIDPPRAPRPDVPHPGLRGGLRLALAAIYFGVGLVHLRRPDAFLPIMPDWVPEPRMVVVATGICELLGSTALLLPRLRFMAGIMLALYAVCVFPANIKHALSGIDVPPIPSTWWYHAPRLLFQPVFVWWALFAGEVVDWPFRRRVRR